MQDGFSRRATFGAIATGVVALLPERSKAETRAGANVVANVRQLKAAAIANSTMLCGGVPFYWETAHAPYVSDEGQPFVTTVKSDHQPLGVGAWVRQSAGKIATDNGGTVQGALDARLGRVGDRAALETYNAAHGFAYLLEQGREGLFKWSSANLSEMVRLDRQQGIYVAPAKDRDGRAGAWVRQHDGAISVRWFGAKGDVALDSRTGKFISGTDDSVAIAAAFRFATMPFGASFCKGLHFPSGIYLQTQNNWIGENLASAGLYSGRLDSMLIGEGRNSSVIWFKPSSAPNGRSACYDQTRTPYASLGGLKVQNLGFVFDDGNDERAPIDFITSAAVPGLASQGFRINDVRFRTRPGSGSILYRLLGAVNEDSITAYDLLLDGFDGVVYSPNNVEAVNHWFFTLDLLDHRGTAFEYNKGGCLKVCGLNAIMVGTDGVDTAVLKLNGGTNSQNYTFDALRAELRGANTRLLMLSVAAENTIALTDSLWATPYHGQAWALIVVQHHASITFTRCIIPARDGSGKGSAGTLRLLDSKGGADYATRGASHSFIRFIDCDCSGDRQEDADGWVDYGHLTEPNANYRSLTVTYRGCGNLPDSVEYGHPYRQGLSFSSDAPPKLIFRGTAFPNGNGTSPVASPVDFHVVVPHFNFVTEIVVARQAMSGAAIYQIEFIDTAERNSPGSGVVFGATRAAGNNVAINQRVAINRQFSGTRAQRTIWARVKTGVALSNGQTGDLTNGGIYAEVM